MEWWSFGVLEQGRVSVVDVVENYDHLLFGLHFDFIQIKDKVLPICLFLETQPFCMIFANKATIKYIHL